MIAGVRVNVVVEGQTEETFVRDVLAPGLGAKGIFLAARRVLTGRHRGRAHRGGMTTFARAERDIREWLRQDPDACVTTMFDLYGLPATFPGRPEADRIVDPYDRVEFLEHKLAEAIEEPSRFLPYLQLHEFEALLFSDVAAIDEVMRLSAAGSRLNELREIRAEFASPELIDDGIETAPSKRILQLCPSYEKPVSGILIAERIGVEKLREECGHFAKWLERLDALAG